MKRLALMAGLLTLGLGACGQNGGVNLGQGFAVDANVIGGGITVAVVEIQDIKTGAFKGYRSTYTLTQPTVTFNALPQSVGLQVQNYTVEVLDNAGARYGDDQGKYQRSASYIIQPGYLCSSAATPVTACSPTAKTPANVATPAAGMILVIDEIASRITSDCQSTGCPTLKLRVTFNGLDDAGRTQNLTVTSANFAASITGRTVIKE